MPSDRYFWESAEKLSTEVGGYRGHRSGPFASHWNKQVSHFAFRVSKRSWTRRLKNLWTAILVQTNDPIGLLSWEHLSWTHNSALREFDIINPGLTSFFLHSCRRKVLTLVCGWSGKHHCPPLPITSGLLYSTSVSSHSKSLFLLPFPWPNSDLSITLTVLHWCVTNRFAHYIVRRGMWKSEEGKNSTDGLIISTQTGRKDSSVKIQYVWSRTP